MSVILSSRPLVETLGTCAIVEIPPREEYSAMQQKVIKDLTQLCFNDPTLSRNGRIYVIPHWIRGIHMDMVWANIEGMFGEPIYVDFLCPRLGTE